MTRAGRTASLDFRSVPARLASARASLGGLRIGDALGSQSSSSVRPNRSRPATASAEDCSRLTAGKLPPGPWQ